MKTKKAADEAARLLRKGVHFYDATQDAADMYGADPRNVRMELQRRSAEKRRKPRPELKPEPKKQDDSEPRYYQPLLPFYSNPDSGRYKESVVVGREHSGRNFVRRLLEDIRTPESWLLPAGYRIGVPYAATVLTEARGTPYPYEYGGTLLGFIPMWRFFDSEGDEFHVILTPIDMHSGDLTSIEDRDIMVVVGFSRAQTHSSEEMTGRYDVFNVLATVEEIVRSWIEERYAMYPEFDAALFFGGTPDVAGGEELGGDPTKRSRVYGRYVKRLARGTDFEFHDTGNAFYLYPEGLYDLEALREFTGMLASKYPDYFTGYEPRYSGSEMIDPTEV